MSTPEVTYEDTSKSKGSKDESESKHESEGSEDESESKEDSKDE